MASELNPWPSTRNTLLVHQIDKIAKNNPETLYAVLPRSPDTVSDGFRDVTYQHLSNAVNGIASWIERTLGKGDGTFPTLTYFGPNDSRHSILLLGAVKTGYKMLFPSPRYGAEPLAALIGALDGTVLLLPDSGPRGPLVGEILAHREMSTYSIPSLCQLLDEQHSHYTYEKTLEEARSEPLVALHTSGTTGFPKPIIWTHDWADSFGFERYLEPPTGFDSMDGHLLGTRVLSFMPPFHASGIFGSIFFSLCRGSVMIYPPSGIPPSAAIAAEMLQHTKADTLAMIVPYLMAAEPHVLDAIASRIKVVMYAGGDLPSAVGDLIASKMYLFTACGSTEMGLWAILKNKETEKKQTDRWHYMHLHPAMNIKMEKMSEEENIYEAVCGLNQETDEASYIQPIFKLLPHLQRYRTADLFTPHPSDPNLWKFYGRADDLQTFASGENFHPVAVESFIGRHPSVSEVLLVGTGRPRAAMIIHLQNQNAGGLDEIWPTIEEANKSCPLYARVARPLVHLVDASQPPFPKTAKGTVQRKATVELYKEELNKLFAHL